MNTPATGIAQRRFVRRFAISGISTIESSTALLKARS